MTLIDRSKATPKLSYRVLTGPDDVTFCERVSDALQNGYLLHGSPSVTFNGERVIVAQALVLDKGGQEVPLPVGPGDKKVAQAEPTST